MPVIKEGKIPTDWSPSWLIMFTRGRDALVAHTEE